MSEPRPSDVLGALPHRRPYRRSDKRASPVQTDGAAPAKGTDAGPRTKAAGAASRRAQPKARARSKLPTPAKPGTQGSAPRPQRLAQPAQPSGVPATPRRRPAQGNRRHVLGTAAQAAAELAEIGLSVGARALRGVVDRLPRP